MRDKEIFIINTVLRSETSTLWDLKVATGLLNPSSFPTQGQWGR